MSARTALTTQAYRGRFAPSPTGPLHAGSLVAALASWLDARAHGGQWLVRMEDVDMPRCVPGADTFLLQQLAACGLVSDEPVVWQSKRSALYQAALQQLIDGNRAYPCACSRKDIELALRAMGQPRERHQAAIYPGTCRPERGGLHGRPPRAWRFLCDAGASRVEWTDRRLGRQAQDVDRDVGDFVLLRADGLWAYQLAVVVDDAEQGINAVVRGEDLADNTARQILLQQALSLPTPSYLHTPLVRDAKGEKLSKQTGAAALNLSDPATALNQAALCLGLPQAKAQVPELLYRWVQAWRERWG
ncbi:glutamyl-Q tRNA(Asp) synthetase [Hydrogenophaga palleronii]|uniref:Glutamyl-Q tRNA(Asp) synthetase n=1 Tax=Hydrogenophaga palleronii TaxID=65655 RepID=A0ABU1WHA4_9BURK|nr:tRNA glutamyl-Q(34) synthetase GluQRS [Hydrogenophaga palleronii]MDR7148462.1 glutamyl-Q tRNA(Asp) synthetase [Hydrogenophaga palleronii]